MQFGFCGSTYISESPTADNQSTVNFYPEIVESGMGRNNVVLYPSPGLTQFGSSPPTGPVRGMIDIGETSGRLFAVIRDRLYEVLSTGTRTDRGAITGISGTVSMAASNTYILIIAGGLGYYYNLSTNVLTQIAAAGFPANAIVGGYSDGYFIVLSTDNYFYISAVDDPSSWAGATARETVQAPSNAAVGMVIINRQIWIMGDRLIQPFWNSGNPTFPYQANLSGTMNQGLVSRFGACVVPDENTVAWLGHNDAGLGVAYMADGFNPVRISDHSFESAVQGYSVITDAVAMTYQLKGHVIVSFTFPTAGTTWRYDFTASKQMGRPMWHQALYWNTSTGLYEAHRALFHTQIFGKHIVGDRASGKLYEMNTPVRSALGVGSFTTDDGDVIRRLRRAPHIHNSNKTIFYGSFELILESGLGLNTGQGSTPQLTMRFSNDGGKTWSDEAIGNAGALGNYKARVRFDYQGSGRDRVYEVVMTDPIPWRLVDGILDGVVVGVS